MPEAAQEFALSGELAEAPLPMLIARVLDEKLTGMLHIEADGASHWIYFEEGFPAGVHAPKSQDFLGSVLRELGYLDDAAFNESLMRMAKTKQLQGQVLLEMGAIDDEKLERGLSLQLARKLTRLFAYREGQYSFAEGEELPPPMDPIRVNPYGLIYNGIKNTYNAEDLKKGLAPLVGRACKVSRLFVQRGELFEFPSDDLADARLLEEFRLPQEFVRGARSGPTAAMMMLLTLQFCNMLEMEEASFAQPMPGIQAPRAAQASAPAAPARPAARPAQSPGSAPAAARSAETSTVSDELRGKITEKFEQIKAADFWGVLEVEKDADSERLKRSFLTLAKVYHPDRVANSGDEELKHRMDVILSKINEAYQTLVDPNARAKYKHDDHTPAEPGKREPRPQEAKIQYQKGIVYFRKRDYMKAAEAFRWAADLDPKNGDYPAYRIWCDYLRGEEPEETKIQNARADLLAVSQTFPDGFYAYRFLSMIYQKLGDNDNYGRMLQKAYKSNPNDHETSRELRLFKSRQEKDSKRSLFGLRRKK
ncbi:MAG: DnaJ domain-containing protein [Deltaproteobacteria bacterium]|nr:DnaJ domain-containing protein [Deltaproteobacteria bacterium]